MRNISRAQKSLNPPHAKKEWRGAGSHGLGAFQPRAAAACIHTSGSISGGVRPWSLQIRYAGHGLLIQIAMDFLTNYEFIRWSIFDCADFLADSSEQQLSLTGC